MNVGFGARRAFRKMVVPGDPLRYAVKGIVTKAETPRHNFSASRSSAYLALTDRQFKVASTGFESSRDQAWLWHSELRAPGELELRWAEEDGLAVLHFASSDLPRLAAFLDRLRKGHRDRLSLLSNSELADRQRAGELGTRKDQNLRDTSHWLIRHAEVHPNGVPIFTYWLGLQNNARAYGSFLESWRFTSRNDAEAAMNGLARQTSREWRAGLAVLSVAEAQAERDGQAAGRPYAK